MSNFLKKLILSMCHCWNIQLLCHSKIRCRTLGLWKWSEVNWKIVQHVKLITICNGFIWFGNVWTDINCPEISLFHMFIKYILCITLIQYPSMNLLISECHNRHSELAKTLTLRRYARITNNRYQIKNLKWSSYFADLSDVCIFIDLTNNLMVFGKLNCYNIFQYFVKYFEKFSYLY